MAKAKSRKYLHEHLPGSTEVIEQMLQTAKPKTAQDAWDVLKTMFSDTLQTMLRAELDAHLGYNRHDQSPKETENRRNGYSKKTVHAQAGDVEVKVPRDREGSFEPVVLPRHSRETMELEEKVITLYSMGVSDRDISLAIEEIYGIKLSRETISDITEVVLERVHEWQSRRLERCYPFVFIDALYGAVKVDGVAQKNAIYVMLGVDEEGRKSVLGLWVNPTEGAKEWLKIFEELKARGVEHVAFMSMDGLKGAEEAAKAAFGAELTVQRCTVHLVRNSVKYIPSKHYKEFCADLKAMYGAVSLVAARSALKALQDKWGDAYPSAVKVWEDNFRFVEQLFDYPPEIRRVIYTTNAVESLNSALRKVTDRKGALPSVNALLKLLYLRVRSIEKKWTMPIQNWAIIRNKLDICKPGWNGENLNLKGN